MRSVLLLLVLGTACRADPMFGIWKMNVARSTFVGAIPPKSFTLQIGPHPKGEVFTVERIEPDGRILTASTILYFDATPRDIQDFECTGTQSSRRMDRYTVEILRTCGSGAWTRLLRRTAQQNQLILEISEQRADGRRFERRLVLEKFSGQ